MVELSASLVKRCEIRLPVLEALHGIEQPHLESDDHEGAEQNQPALLYRWHEVSSPGQDSRSAFNLSTNVDHKCKFVPNE